MLQAYVSAIRLKGLIPRLGDFDQFKVGSGDKKLEANEGEQLASSFLSLQTIGKRPTYTTARTRQFVSLLRRGVERYENSPARLSRCPATA